MKCSNCDVVNDNDSTFCQSCGKELTSSKTTAHKPIHDTNTHTTYVDTATKPYPYVISNWKLIIMCVFTFGIFELYWFYRQWKSFNAEGKLNHGSLALWVYAIFSPISAYWLFKNISEKIKEHNKGKGLEPGGLAVVYFFASRIWLGFLPLIPVQNKVNLYWEKKYEEKLVRSGFGVWNWLIIILVVLFMFFAYYSEDTTIENDYPSSNLQQSSNSTTIDNSNQEEIASSVVNIFCPSTLSDEESSGGSGVILTEDGIVLTNSHIIPQNEDELFVDETGCIVVLPDPTSGQPSEIYWATPVVLQGISDDYDLAYMIIYDAYFDEETGEYQGVYPKTFPAFDDTTRCNNEDLKLGEFVRIYGYPAISGGYSLTVTDGTISSFPGEGLIVTSAKISHGNSGGLAVDKDGCMIGVPSLVSSDENESLGVIYSMDLVHEFSGEVERYLNNLE